MGFGYTIALQKRLKTEFPPPDHGPVFLLGYLCVGHSTPNRLTAPPRRVFRADTVQRVRLNRRRPTKMNGQNKYSGLMAHADYRSTMVRHRIHMMKPIRNNFTCRTYQNEETEVCAAHCIRECVLDQVVLEGLRQVTAVSREHTREFAEHIGGKHSAELPSQERELSAMWKCSAELDIIFKKLYEDRLLGLISVEQFQALSGGCTAEQEKPAAETPVKESTPEAAGYRLQHR